MVSQRHLGAGEARRARVGVFHPGTQHSWQTALALQQLDCLAWYATSIFYRPDRWPYRLERLPGPLGEKLGREFRRFAMPALDPALVHTSGAFEWLERIAARLGRRGLARRLDAIGNRRFASAIADRVRADPNLALWGYDGSARTAFELARQRGNPCILDRTIGDGRAYNAAMAEVRARYPEWFLPIEREVPEWIIERSEAEYALADRILVGCEHAAETVRRHATTPGVAEKVGVLPYCFDEALFGSQPAPRPVDRAGPVKFLFVGLVNPRKGIHHLLEAIAQIPRGEAELTVVGDLRVPREVFARHADRVTYRATVPRGEIPAIMRDHHVLVFPSYFEGSALSLLEALASGMAVIQTRQAGNGATGETGVVLDRPDTEALLAAMRLPVEDRDLLDSWRAAAQGEAANYTFARYREGIARTLGEMGLATG